MYLITQDQDAIVQFNPSTDTLYTLPRFNEGMLWGFNLFKTGYENVLGTFNSILEAETEMFLILTCEKEYHQISGYSPWEEFEELTELWEEVDVDEMA